jgi:[ribosomal protein S18]-alanine N-acetyltransferase
VHPHIRALGGPDEAARCAALMAATDPWLTLGLGSSDALAVLQEPGREVHVWAEEGAVLGVVVLVLEGALVGYVNALCVAPEARGRGIGTALLRQAEARSARVAPDVFLCVSSFNHRARAFYERLGYEVVGELPDYVRAGYGETLMRRRSVPWAEFEPATSGAAPPDADPLQALRILRVAGGPAARPADVATPTAVVAALYDVISGPAESERARDWDRFRALHLPTARYLLARWGTGDAEEEVLREWSVEAFIAAARGFWWELGFWEREVWSRVERYGNVAHVLSTYESRAGSAESEPVGGGINSVQLVRHDGRWWIAGLAWDVTRPGNPIPPEYLPRG